MRISRNKDDPGYPDWRKLQREGNTFKARVDEMKVGGLWVRTVDDEEGFAERIVTGPKGPILNDDGTYRLERIEGQVRIKIIRQRD